MPGAKQRTGGPRGRPSKPTAVKKLTGERKDRVNNQEPGFPITIPVAPPAHLDRIGREHWMTYAPMFAKAGTLLEVDYSSLELASERWSVYRKAAARLRDPEISIAEMVKINQVAASAATAYWAIMREYGAGAASRSRIKVDKAPEKSEFEEYEVA